MYIVFLLLCYICSCSNLSSAYVVKYVPESIPHNHLRPFYGHYWIGEEKAIWLRALDRDESSSPPSGSLYIKPEDENVVYYASLNENHVNYRSICLNNKHKFLVFDSAKVEIIKDSCTDGSRIEDGSDTTHQIYSSIGYVDYSDSKCANGRNYSIILRDSGISNNLFDAGQGIKVLRCSSFTAIISTRITNIRRERIEDVNDHVHVKFNNFVAGDSIPKQYSSVSLNLVNIREPHVFHYCYVRGKIKVYFIDGDQFIIRDDGFVELVNVSSIVYFGYILTDSGIDELDCFLS